MRKARLIKITVWVPRDLLCKAMKTSGLGITATVRMALELLVRSQSYCRQLARHFRHQSRLPHPRKPLRRA